MSDQKEENTKLPQTQTQQKPTTRITNGPSSSSFSGHKAHFVNPPDASNPDPATLREQWKFAIRQYSRWYSHAWGTAIFAGGAFFALGWFIKGGNPLPSFNKDKKEKKNGDGSGERQES